MQSNLLNLIIVRVYNYIPNILLSPSQKTPSFSHHARSLLVRCALHSSSFFSKFQSFLCELISHHSLSALTIRIKRIQETESIRPQGSSNTLSRVGCRQRIATLNIKTFANSIRLSIYISTAIPNIPVHIAHDVEQAFRCVYCSLGRYRPGWPLQASHSEPQEWHIHASTVPRV